MAHASLKLIPGVDVNKTPALNEAAISSCNLIRFVPDRAGLGLAQKLGGWTKFFPTAMQTITRALWAWEDTNSNQHLAVGNEAAASSYQAQLAVITNGNLIDITPRTITTNPAVNFSTVTGSNVVTIVDAGITTTSYDSVFISTQISVGGLVLFGFYPVTVVSGTTYTINAVDLFGNPLTATATVTSGGSTAQFTTVSGTGIVTVTLANHGYSAGSSFTVNIPVSVGGIVFYGDYSILSVLTSNTFTIQASNTATSSASVFMNSGNANFVYYIGFGTVPAGTGYGIGGYGSGGYGTGSGIVPTTGVPVYTNDWTLDNWGEILVACPVPAFNLSFNSLTLSGTGTVVTATFSGTYVIPVGNTVTLSGASPNAYNGTYVVTASGPGTISFAGTATGAQTSAALIQSIDPASGPIFQYDPTSGQPIATVIPQAPPVNDGMFVAMPQRQIIAWGSTFSGIADPLLIRWCDVQNYGAWIAQSTNQAGSFRIPKGSRIVGCIQGPQQGLVWTDLAVWSMQYIGQPYIYSFNEIAAGCGMIGRKAAGSFNGVVYWMGQSQFFSLSGSGVQPIPCPIWDVIFQQIDMSNVNKIRVAVNSRFNEVAWYYPTTTSNGEVAAYVKYNTVIGQWDYGSLGRSAWINESIFGPPIGADPVSKYIYQHETSTDADGSAMNSFFQTGYFVINEADNKAFIDQVWPDAKWGYYNGTQSAQLNMTFYTDDYAGQTPISYGPFTLTQSTTFISPRLRGRLVSINVGSNDVGSFWRIGNIRYRFQADGKY